MNKSESIANLAKALAQFQAEVANPKNTANNPYFNSKYAPLNEILNDVRPLMAKHGLAVIQSPSGDGANIVITTMLLHSSGEWIELEPLTLKADKPTAQGAGSAITYGRRYALSALLGISSEDDDDGNHASGNKEKQKEAPKAKDTGPKASESQVKAIYAIAKQKGLEAQLNAFLQKNGIGDVKELTKQQASQVIAMMQNAEVAAGSEDIQGQLNQVP